MSTLRSLFASPLTSVRQWVIVGVVALAFALMPQLANNDWTRNVGEFPRGLTIYDAGDHVFPPHALVVLIPYYLLGEAGSRVAAVLVIGWLVARRGWTLLQFFFIVLSPLFLWMMVLSSPDVFVLLLPILLWETSEQRQNPLLRGLALALVTIKPQAGIGLALYFLWTLRRLPRELLATLVVAVLLIVPISLVSQPPSPPLLIGWIHNLQNPVAENLDHWVYNNLSLSFRYGLPLALAVTAAAFGGLYALIRARRRRWTRDHTCALLLVVPMLLMPYASNQGAIIPLALLPTGPGWLAQVVGVFGAALINQYALLDEWLLIALMLLALWLRSRPLKGLQQRVNTLPLLAMLNRVPTDQLLAARVDRCGAAPMPHRSVHRGIRSG